MRFHQVVKTKFATNAAILREKYVAFLIRFSWLLIATVFATAIALSVLSICFYKAALTFDPRIGFETRGTSLSNQRLAIQNLLKVAATSSEMASLRTEKSATLFETNSASGFDSGVVRHRKQSMNDSNTIVAHDEYGIDSYPSLDVIHGACDQYFALGSFIQHNYIEYLSKVVFRVNSFDNLFSMATMRRLCDLDALINKVLASTSSIAPSTIKKLPYSFNLPYYTMCLNMRFASNSCDSLNENDIRMFATMVMKCASENAPPQCFTPMARQVSNMIFEEHKGPVISTQPLYIAAVLPIVMSWDDSQNINFYNTLLENLERYYGGSDLLLMGASFNVKQTLFERLVLCDTLLGIVALLLVVLIVLIYSNSVLFTLIVSAALILSVGVSFFVYTVIFRVIFFPFLNLLAIVLIVAVGADDAFLFLYQFRKHKQEMKAVQLFIRKTKDDGTASDDKVKQRRIECVRCCLSETLNHAAIAMFVTSATTAVAFYANVASKIVVLR